MIRSKDLLISNLIEAVSKALDTSSLDKQIEALSNELNDMNKKFELLVKMNTTRSKIKRFGEKSMQNLKIFIKTKKQNLIH